MCYLILQFAVNSKREGNLGMENDLNNIKCLMPNVRVQLWFQETESSQFTAGISVRELRGFLLMLP